MDTKWKNRMMVSLCSLLFTFGLSGIFTIFTHGNTYTYSDYFRTPDFLHQMQGYTQYLSLFELNNKTIEESKQSLTVNEDEINEYRTIYRNRYRDLTEDISNIKLQYEMLIQTALANDNKELAEIYTKERDEAIEHISQVFKNDDYVKAIIISNKEKLVEEFYRHRELYLAEYSKYKDSFIYHFTNSETGEVFTNDVTSNDQSITDIISSDEMIYVANISIPKEDYLLHHITGYYLVVDSFHAFEGQIAVSNSLSSSNPLMIEFEHYKQKQLLWFIHILASVFALALCIYLIRKNREIVNGINKWMLMYNKLLPIDLKLVFFVLIGLWSVNILYSLNEQIYNVWDKSFVYWWNIVISFVFSNILWYFTVIQGYLIASQLKMKKNIQEVWQKAIINRVFKLIKRIYSNIMQRLRDTFLYRSTGFQLFAMLIIIFLLGLTAPLITIDSFFFFVYVLFLLFIGLPVVWILIKRVGYFNRIVMKTSELATGYVGEDLAVKGKSVLAEFATHINLLKQGLKTSQNVQAKSERLKTELITNVSHDLRTPLTSIINYTELLKSDELPHEDRTAYLEIIDRKSKRLKVLIDDLFDISKMASGNLELKVEKVDLIQLLQQALAEYDSTITDSSLQFRITHSNRPVYALVDGKQFWRVFDNLIGNILKYSLENSRVYINVSTNNNHVTMTFKNVSKYELIDQSDELLERFKRGDTSRHTEGSGLGLAISKSIVEMHDGDFKIEIEGDLFKVSIELKTIE